MNIVEEIRTYVKSIAREINPRIIENDQAHTPDTVGQFKFDESYFLRFVQVPISQGQGHHQYQFSIEIEIAAKAGAKVLESHDKVLCDAIGFAVRLVDKEKYAGLFNNVQMTSLEPEAITGNQRWTKVIINANMVALIKDGIK